MFSLYLNNTGLSFFQNSIIRDRIQNWRRILLLLVDPHCQRCFFGSDHLSFYFDFWWYSTTHLIYKSNLMNHNTITKFEFHNSLAICLREIRNDLRLIPRTRTVCPQTIEAVDLGHDRVDDASLQHQGVVSRWVHEGSWIRLSVVDGHGMGLILFMG